MKSAREQAEDLWKVLPASAQLAIDLNFGRASVSANENGQGRERWLKSITLTLKEHARNQRRLAACFARDEVGNAPAHAFVRDYASAVHRAAMNAPAPGEK